MISIVVVTFNRLEYTKQCIQSILDNTDVDFELILADNGSTDGTPEWLHAFESELVIAGYIKRLAVTLFDDNKGCATGYNLGFAQASGDLIWRIDNDVLLPAGWASAMVRAMELDPKLGMLTTDLETDPLNNPQNVRVNNPKITYFNQTVWHDCGLGSWCMAHRKSMFDEIGFYTTIYDPIVLNDTDLEKKAQNAGWKLGTLTGLSVGHLWGTTNTPEESEYNHWKIAEQGRKIALWEEEWRVSDG